MLKMILQNTRKPQGFWGKMMLWSMNVGHGPMARWGLKYLKVTDSDQILDIGCGGGRNIKRLLKKAPSGRVFGVDYSALSVRKSRRLNANQVLKDRAIIVQGSVSRMPFKTGTLDIATAFETVYFWPDIIRDLQEVRRVLKPGGRILICNEAVHEDIRPDKYDFFVKAVGMKIYSENELFSALQEAGYIRIKAFWHQSKNRICMIAQKPEGDERGGHAEN